MIRSILALVLCLTSVASGSIIFSGTTDLNRAASAQFTVIGNTMSVELTNTSSADVANPLGILTAVFFEIGTAYAGATFSPQTASLGMGSVVHFGPNGGGNVSGEWAFSDSLVGAPLGLQYGIGSAGFGLFAPSELFPGGSVLTPPVEPDGLNYGITSAGDDVTTGNMAVTGGTPLIQNSVTFDFTVSDGFDEAGITRAYLQYGTALFEGGFEGNLIVPNASSYSLLIFGGLCAYRRYR